MTAKLPNKPVLPTALRAAADRQGVGPAGARRVRIGDLASDATDERAHGQLEASMTDHGGARTGVGFIYVMTTVTEDYAQMAFCNVPMEWSDRLYFGPCKRPVRRKLQPGDFLFAISPSASSPRRIVFAAQVEERITFREAYGRFPHLRGPSGPIHVRPVARPGVFPESAYEHIPGSVHADEWKNDVASPELDAFFVCRAPDGWVGRWLGANGPAIEGEILSFLRTCEVHGKVGRLASRNDSGTYETPIAHGGLYTGLHLETHDPARLLALFGPQLANGPSTSRPGATTEPTAHGRPWRLGGCRGGCESESVQPGPSGPTSRC